MPGALQHWTLPPNRSRPTSTNRGGVRKKSAPPRAESSPPTSLLLPFSAPPFLAPQRLAHSPTFHLHTPAAPFFILIAHEWAVACPRASRRPSGLPPLAAGRGRRPRGGARAGTGAGGPRPGGPPAAAASSIRLRGDTPW